MRVTESVSDTKINAQVSDRKYKMRVTESFQDKMSKSPFLMSWYRFNVKILSLPSQPMLNQSLDPATTLKICPVNHLSTPSYHHLWRILFSISDSRFSMVRLSWDCGDCPESNLQTLMTSSSTESLRQFYLGKIHHFQDETAEVQAF